MNHVHQVYLQQPQAPTLHTIEEVKTGSQTYPHDPIHFWPLAQFSKIEREGEKIQSTLNRKLYYITSTPNKGVQILTFTPTLTVEVLQLCVSQVIYSKKNNNNKKKKPLRNELYKCAEVRSHHYKELLLEHTRYIYLRSNYDTMTKKRPDGWFQKPMRTCYTLKL